jgi:hypothetical protein
MFWKLVISALVLPISIGFSSTAAQASVNSKDSFLNETYSNTSQDLGTAADSSQLIATHHDNCSYGHRRHHGGHGHGGHHKNSFGGHGGHGHGGHHNNRHGHGGHGHGGHHKNSFGGHGGHGHGGHHNNSYGHGGHHNSH